MVPWTLVTVFAVAGCGGDEGTETIVETQTVTDGATTEPAPEEGPTTEAAPQDEPEDENDPEQAVEEALNNYYEAFVAMDYEAVCELYAPRILSILGAQSGDPEGEACADRLGRFNRGPLLRDAASFEVKVVNIDGNRAVASVKTEDERNAIRLVRVDGEWRIEESPE